MWKRSISHWIVIAISTLIVAFCAYVIYLGVITGDRKGIWIFAIFGFLFSIPLIVSIFHFIADKSPGFNRIYSKAIDGEHHRPPFVPHWFVLAGIFCIGLSLVFVIIRGMLSFLTR
jgi:hypothetical protein